MGSALVLLLLLVLAILLFGGLGIFVARIFLLALVIALVLSLFMGGSYYRGRRGRTGVGPDPY